jgi:hypothetical protein
MTTMSKKSRKIRKSQKDDKWYKPFIITSVCRKDLTEFLSTDEAIAMTDEQMQHIAEYMEDVFIAQMFWPLLIATIELVTTGKTKGNTDLQEYDYFD